MMNIVFFCQEYRKNIDQFFTGTITSADKQAFSDAANELVRLHTALCTQGLLGLVDESESKNVSELVLGEELWRMLDMVCCGTESEIFEEICFMRYVTAGYCGKKGMLYLLYFAICLDIQAQVSAKVIEERIKALLPDGVKIKTEMITT